MSYTIDFKNGTTKKFDSLSGADLRGADLRGADLRGADLRYADLSGADLRCANLRGANLRGADLRGADLSGADLRYADLRYADLRYAGLSYAGLNGVNLSGANLSGANLSHANLDSTIGNNHEIKTIQLGTYIINIVGEIVQISCQRHTFDEWLSFSDSRIDNMDQSLALKWWKKYKPVLITIMEGLRDES